TIANGDTRASATKRQRKQASTSTWQRLHRSTSPWSSLREQRQAVVETDIGHVAKALLERGCSPGLSRTYHTTIGDVDS
ncbi:MAG: hypothetical protein ACR2RE_26155, partial [Geminicoccaceae bacterium]